MFILEDASNQKDLQQEDTAVSENDTEKLEDISADGSNGTKANEPEEKKESEKKEKTDDSTTVLKKKAIDEEVIEVDTENSEDDLVDTSKPLDTNITVVVEAEAEPSSDLKYTAVAIDSTEKAQDASNPADTEAAEASLLAGEGEDEDEVWEVTDEVEEEDAVLDSKSIKYTVK